MQVEGRKNSEADIVHLTLLSATLTSCQCDRIDILPDYVSVGAERF